MHTKMRLPAMISSFAFAALLAGCGSGDPTYTIADGNLSGKVFGQAWSFTSGFTDSFLSKDDSYSAALYPDKVDKCDSQPMSKQVLLIPNIPKVAGDVPLSLSHSVTFSQGSDNKIALDGLLSVTKVTDTTVEAGLYAIFNKDPDNEVSGHFTLTVCPKTM
jgi:hypothetical protein